MPSQRPDSGEVAVDDLESTAKLPVLGVAAIDDLDVEDESHLRTTVLPPDAFSTSDTHPGIPILKESPGLAAEDVRVVVREAAAASAARAHQGESRAAAEAEAAVGQLLERQAELLREMQEVREEAEARYQRLESDLDDARRLGEDLDAMRREAEARTLAAEQRSAALEAEFAAARDKLEAEAQAAAVVARRSIEDESAALRGQLEAQLEAARRQLVADADAARAQREAEAAALRAEGETSQAALQRRLEAEHEATRVQLGGELAALREQLGNEAATHAGALQAARDEAAGLGRQLAELRTLRSQDEASLARMREELAALGRSLEESRASLVAAELAAQQALAGRDRELERLRGELAELKSLAAAQVEALQAAESRRGIWASLLGDAESAHDAQLREARESAEAEQVRAAAAQAELDARLAEQAGRETALRAEIEAAGTRRAELEAQLEALQARERDALAQVAAASADGAVLERQLEALQKKVEAGDPVARTEIETLRAEQAVLRAERDSLLERHAIVTAAAEASSARAAELEARLGAEDPSEALRALQAEQRRGAERVVELESDLRAAEDQINRLEGELRIKSGRLDELARTGWPAQGGMPEMPSTSGRRRDEYAARGRGLGDVGATGETVLPSDSAFSGAGAAASADGVTRYFVLMDGDTEIVHVLGRRTTIGRGLDNDVRIDTKFISRHHAVVLAGPSQTVVEDLRSTNGVLVNGRRVTRSALRDGDIVHVGKTQFRFVQRHRER